MARFVDRRFNVGTSAAGVVDLLTEQDADGTYHVYSIINLPDGREHQSKSVFSTSDAWEAAEYVSVFKV
ncbi:hypothetical protein NCTGTJJY_CDS0283 [Serratia phage 92A1]|nr:hypothetical protein NCTGTJJY_CDS0283 [Serratia phage 92A1]